MGLTDRCVGVGGFSLGGGYSWKTNQVGLTVDTIIAFELVTPTGSIVQVSNRSNPDLFFALKVRARYTSELFADGTE